MNKKRASICGKIKVSNLKLKQNPALIALASDKEEDLYQATQKD